MRSVIDASFVLDFLLPDEQTARVLDIFEDYKKKDVSFVSSPILQFEVTNSLKYAVGSKRITKQDASKILLIFLDLRIEFIEVDIKECLELSFERDLSVYDASYLYLSQKYDVPLLTLDKKLKSIVN